MGNKETKKLLKDLRMVALLTDNLRNSVNNNSDVYEVLKGSGWSENEIDDVSNIGSEVVVDKVIDLIEELNKRIEYLEDNQSGGCMCWGFD